MIQHCLQRNVIRAQTPLIKHFPMCTLFSSDNVASVIHLGSTFKNDTVAYVFAVGSGTNEGPYGGGRGMQEVADSLTREIRPTHLKDAARVGLYDDVLNQQTRVLSSCWFLKQSTHAYFVFVEELHTSSPYHFFLAGFVVKLHVISISLTYFFSPSVSTFTPATSHRQPTHTNHLRYIQDVPSTQHPPSSSSPLSSP